MRWIEVMSTSIYIPERLAEEVERRGLSIVDLIASALELDPKAVVEARLELAEKYLGEAEERIVKGDAVKASEKLYKVVEEYVKALAQHYATLEHQAAVGEGRWWAQLLGKAARRLSKMLGEPKIEYAWAVAYDIHVWGFHEAKYGVEDVREDVGHVKWLLNYARQAVAAERERRP
jgi:hypothetical protein